MGTATRTTIEGLLTDLLTAIMFHTKLDTIRHEVAPALMLNTHASDDVPAWPPATVQDCIDSHDVVRSFHEAHMAWQGVDYKQILEWSCAILNLLPASSAAGKALRIIANSALSIQRSAGSNHHDLVGITFCQSIKTAKNDGSMYTTIPAATMLAHLLFGGIEIDWSDFDQVTSLRIVDFACGTGTLLIAAANYILHNERTNRRQDVAQALLEQMLYGFDINNRAVFQSATGLGMIAPSVQFKRLHLYGMLLGIDPKTQEGRLGSLELLHGLDQGNFNPRPFTGARIDDSIAPIDVVKFDVAIMNPPFTRADLIHKQFDKPTLEALRQRRKDLMQSVPAHGSSNANYFFALAAKHLKRRGGRMGFVVPSATASNPSAERTRKYLGTHFHVAYLIMSYDPDRIAHSGNTDIGEMLVVLECNTDGRKPTTVVKLTTNPATASDAVACASSILSGDTESNEWGTVDFIPKEAIEQGNWSATQFASKELYKIATTQLWDSVIGNQLKIGTQGSTIRTQTRKCDERAVNAVPALYDHKVKHVNALEVEPDMYVQPKDASTRAKAAVSNPTGLHLPERLWLTTVKSVAVRTTTPSVGSAWMCASPLDINGIAPDDLEKAICMILNSSPGKLGMLLIRNNFKLSYPKFAKSQLEQIPFPRLRDLRQEQIQGLAAAYDDIATLERTSLPETHKCPVQISIDDAVCKYIEFDPELCQTIRHLIVQEPMVSGKRDIDQTNP